MTVTTYAVPEDVNAYLLLTKDFGDTDQISTGLIERYILQAEGLFEKRTGQAFKPKLVTQEMWDVEAVRSRYREMFDDEWFSVPRPFKLMHHPVHPMDSNLGHKIEVYEGDEGSFTDVNPEGSWTDYLTEKTQGRQQDWWLDEQQGILYVRKVFLFRRNALLRVTYSYGKPIATLDGQLAQGATTATVTSTFRYQSEGMVRIGDEWIHHTGKTDTTLTGLTRGALGTTDATHATGGRVIEVPMYVNELVAKKAAAEYLAHQVRVGTIADKSGTAKAIKARIDDLRKDWEKGIGGDYQRWTLL